MIEAEDFFKRIFDSSGDGIIITDLENWKILSANPAAARLHGYLLADFCKLRIIDLIFPQPARMLDDLKEKMLRGEEFRIFAQHIRKDASLVYLDWHSVPFIDHNKLCVLSFLRDINQRIQGENQSTQFVIERELELNTLLEISQTLASRLELNPELILDQLGILIKYSHASLFTTADSTLIALAVRGNGRMGMATPFTIKLNGQDTLDILFNDRKPIRISDIWNDDKPALFLRKLLTGESAALIEGMRSWMWVPLAVKRRIVGGFGLASSIPDYFTSHDADLAMTIANQAAVTLVNAELFERAQALAAIQERQRLAQNLHDAVNQSLFSASLITEVLPRLWEKDPEAGKRSLIDLRHLINGAIAEMRTLLAELRPTTLTDSELGDLLITLGNAFTGRTNIPVNIIVLGERRLKAQTQVAIYRICQEALNNIAKHAKAENVEIELRHSARSVNLKIRDDGRGFEISGHSDVSHFGLTMMRERAETSGGIFKISSQVGLGTAIEVNWNIKKAV